MAAAVPANENMREMLKKDIFKLYRPERGPDVWIPVYMSAVQAGFPSPADDYLEGEIDLNREFVKDWACTFYVRAAGDSMTGDHIDDGDLLLVDKSVKPHHNCIAVCYYDGGFTVKRLLYDDKAKTITLMPSNPKYKPVTVQDGEELIVWGVVRSIHRNMMK